MRMESRIIRMPFSFLPMLSFPWNAADYAEEHAFLNLVHTMKKKIL